MVTMCSNLDNFYFSKFLEFLNNKHLQLVTSLGTAFRQRFWIFISQFYFGWLENNVTWTLPLKYWAKGYLRAVSFTTHLVTVGSCPQPNYDFFLPENLNLLVYRMLIPEKPHQIPGCTFIVCFFNNDLCSVLY